MGPILAHVPRAYVGLGANLGDRAGALVAARDGLARLGRIVASSSLYETAPWGRTDQPAFLNACCAVETAVTPPALRDELARIEAELGRSPGERWGPREIDLDLLLYGQTVWRSEGLAVPHGRLLERVFALAPLAEIAPDVPVPDAGVTVAEALRRLPRTPGDAVTVEDPRWSSGRAAQ